MGTIRDLKKEPNPVANKGGMWRCPKCYVTLTMYDRHIIYTERGTRKDGRVTYEQIPKYYCPKCGTRLTDEANWSWDEEVKKQVAEAMLL